METDNLLFFDTEFTDLSDKADLISLGITDITGNFNLYAEFTDFSESACSKFVRTNVLPNLRLKLRTDQPYFKTYWAGKNLIYCGPSDNHFVLLFLYWLSLRPISYIMWSDCYAYDWVLFRKLFANTEPPMVNYIPRDLSTLFDAKGIDPDISREEFVLDEIHKMSVEYVKFFGLESKDLNIPKHNSLWDAIVIRECYKKLQGMKNA